MIFYKKLLKKTLLRSMNKLIAAFCLLSFACVFGQDSNTSKKRFKIDGVASVVGDYVILESDIDLSLIHISEPTRR